MLRHYIKHIPTRDPSSQYVIRAVSAAKVLVEYMDTGLKMCDCVCVCVFRTCCQQHAPCDFRYIRYPRCMNVSRFSEDYCMSSGNIWTPATYPHDNIFWNSSCIMEWIAAHYPC